MTDGAAPMTAWPADYAEAFARDPGGLALLPLAVWWLVVLGWVVTTDRLGQDAVTRRLNPGLWGMLLAFPFLAMAILAWWIPVFWFGLLLMLTAWWGPMLAYSRVRNRSVSAGESILTPAHARRLLSQGLGRFGIELPESGAETMSLLPAVTLAADPSAAAEEQARRQRAMAEMPGQADASRLLAEAVAVNASGVLFDLVGDRIAVREEIDGVWHPRRAWVTKRERMKRFEQCVEADPLARPQADAIRDAVIAACGIDPRVPKSRRSGRFGIKIDGKPWVGKVSTRAAGNTEQVLVRWSPQVPPFKTLADLGMKDTIAERLTGLLALEKGLVIVAVPGGSGGSTTFEVALQSADRLVRNFVAIEDAASPHREVQNVKPYRFDAKAGVTPVQALEKALREYPQVIVAPELADGQLASALVASAEAEQFVVVALQASGAVDGIDRLLQLGVDRQKLATSLLAVVSQRLLRRLCPKCREERPTPPELLAKLRASAATFPHVFTASKEGCRLCHGTGYRGRTGVFEIAGGQTVRMAIAKKVDQDTLLKAAVKDGMRKLSDASLRLVVDGTTSLEERQRVFQPAAKPAAAAVKGAKQ